MQSFSSAFVTFASFKSFYIFTLENVLNYAKWNCANIQSIRTTKVFLCQFVLLSFRMNAHNSSKGFTFSLWITPMMDWRKRIVFYKQKRNAIKYGKYSKENEEAISYHQQILLIKYMCISFPRYLSDYISITISACYIAIVFTGDTKLIQSRAFCRI